MSIRQAFSGGSGASIGGSITGATEGSVLFAGASGVLAQDNDNFFWDDTLDKLSLTSTTTVTVANVGSVTFGFNGDTTFIGDGSNVFATVYAYKDNGLYRTYSPIGTASATYNDGYAEYGAVVYWTAVSGVDGYKVVFDAGAMNGIYYGTVSSALTSVTVFGAGWTTSNSTVTPSSPQDVKQNVLSLTGLMPLTNVDFTGKLRLYDTTTQAVVIGDITGNTRGTKAIDIVANRFGATSVASGNNSILIANGAAAGIASGANSIVLGYGTASANYAVAIQGGTATSSDAIAIGNADATNTSALALGANSLASGSVSVAILGTSSGSGSTAIGQQSTASGSGSFALGFYSNASGEGTIAIGRGTQSSGIGSTVIGSYFTNNTNYAISFGTGTSTTLGGNSTLLQLTDTRVDFYRDIFTNVSTGGNIVQNGTFGNTLYWTRGTNWTITGGTARATAVTTGKLTQAAADLLATITVGNKYRLTYTVSSWINGDVRGVVGGVNFTARGANGTYIEDITAVTGSTDLFFECVTTPATLRIDNVTLVRVVEGDVNASGTVTGANVASTSLTSGRVVFAGSGGLLTSDGNFTWNNSTELATLNGLAETITTANVATYTPTDGGGSDGYSHDGDYYYWFKVYAYKNVGGSKVYSSTDIANYVYFSGGEYYTNILHTISAVSGADGYVIVLSTDSSSAVEPAGSSFNYYRDIGNVTAYYDNNGGYTYYDGGGEYIPTPTTIGFTNAPLLLNSGVNLATSPTDVLKFGSAPYRFQWQSANTRLSFLDSSNAVQTIQANISGATSVAANTGTFTTVTGAHSTGSVASAVGVAVSSISTNSFLPAIISSSTTGAAIRYVGNSSLMVNTTRKTVAINGASELGSGVSGTMLSITSASSYAALSMKSGSSSGIHFVQVIDSTGTVRAVYRDDGNAIFGSISYSNFGRASFLDAGLAGNPFSGQLPSVLFARQDDENVWGIGVCNSTYDVGNQKISVAVQALNAGGGWIGTPDATAFHIRTNNTKYLELSSAGVLTHYYDASNRWNITVGSTGGVTFDAVGAGSEFIFSDNVSAPLFKTTTAPTANSSGTVSIVAKDAGALTANAGWLPMKRSDGTTVYLPYWT